MVEGGFRFDDVDRFPVAAEVLGDAGRQLEPHAQAPVLEEDVRVLELGHVEGDPLPLLGQGALGATDEARALEGVDPAVAGRNRDAVLTAQVDGGLGLLERGDEDLRRVLVGNETRCLQRIRMRSSSFQMESRRSMVYEPGRGSYPQ